MSWHEVAKKKKKNLGQHKHNIHFNGTDIFKQRQHFSMMQVLGRLQLHSSSLHCSLQKIYVGNTEQTTLTLVALATCIISYNL